MIYRNYEQIGNDCMKWAAGLPKFAAIAGVPRSGMIFASMLATYQNTHLISLNDLIWGVENWKEPLRRNCPAKDGLILVVDDAVATGQRMTEIKQQLSGLPYPIATAAYIAMPQGRKTVDFAFEETSEDHLFQFNIFHHWFNEQMMTDLDGVLSEDWNYQYETGDLAETYANHLQNSLCLFQPTFTMGAIVTGRLECHRAATEAWLAKYNIKYHKLIMYPADKPENRFDVGLWKGLIYKNSNARLFVESCPNQSLQIKEASGRQVIDWSQQKIL